MELLAGPGIEAMPAVPTVGIRVRTPFRGMLAKRDELLAELVGCLDQQAISDLGHFFLRLNVVDMEGVMDLEVGVTGVVHPGDERVRPGSLPAGNYATLTYRDHARRANKLLLDWVRDNNISPDVSTAADGDHFTCRTELYITDPRTERKKTRWAVQLLILTADAALQKSCSASHVSHQPSTPSDDPSEPGDGGWKPMPRH